MSEFFRKGRGESGLPPQTAVTRERNQRKKKDLPVLYSGGGKRVASPKTWRKKKDRLKGGKLLAGRSPGRNFIFWKKERKKGSDFVRRKRGGGQGLNLPSTKGSAVDSHGQLKAISLGRERKGKTVFP